MMIRRKRRAGWLDEAPGTSKSLLGRYNRSWRSGSPFVFLAKHTSYPPVTAASGRKATLTSHGTGFSAGARSASPVRRLKQAWCQGQRTWGGQAREIVLDGEIAVPDIAVSRPGHRPARGRIATRLAGPRVGAFWKPGDPALISFPGPAWLGAR